MVIWGWFIIVLPTLFVYLGEEWSKTSNVSRLIPLTFIFSQQRMVCLWVFHGFLMGFLMVLWGSSTGNTTNNIHQVQERMAEARRLQHELYERRDSSELHDFGQEGRGPHWVNWLYLNYMQYNISIYIYIYIQYQYIYIISVYIYTISIYIYDIYMYIYIYIISIYIYNISIYIYIQFQYIYIYK